MSKWLAFASVRSIACALAFALIGAVVVVATSPSSVAEPKKGGGGKGKSEEQTQPQQPAPPQLTFSPWTKICPKEANGPQVCFTGKDGRVATGQPVVAAVLIEPQGEP